MDRWSNGGILQRLLGVFQQEDIIGSRLEAIGSGGAGVKMFSSPSIDSAFDFLSSLTAYELSWEEAPAK